MKKMIGMALTAGLLSCALTACNEQKAETPKTDAQQVETANPQPSKSVIVFYSQTGTTKKVAEEFGKATGASAVELKLVNPYPSTYDSTIARTRVEREGKNWPALETA